MGYIEAIHYEICMKDIDIVINASNSHYEEDASKILSFDMRDVPSYKIYDDIDRFDAIMEQIKPE